MTRKSRMPATAPSLDGVIYNDENGKRITREQFTTPKPYAVSVDAMAAHLEALAKWMRGTEASA